ncbi:MAG: chemotaxis protein CheD [Deltaproteobacteria bacterium]|nr:chemotaxis protein CheD [Deltaproteobacteria bacterium]
MPETSVKLLQCAVARSGLLRIDRIGSGVGVILYDTARKIGAGLHILAPHSGTIHPENPVMYANTAIPFVLGRLESDGGKRPLSVAIAGGASMMGREDKPNAGAKVVEAVKAALAGAGLQVKLDQTGGAQIRSIVLDIDAGKIKIG